MPVDQLRGVIVEKSPTAASQTGAEHEDLAGYMPEMPSGSARVIPLGLTFDDVLLQPGRVGHRAQPASTPGPG